MKRENNQMTTISYRSGDESLLDEIRELWETLNQYHGQVSENFKAHYKGYVDSFNKF